MDKYENLKDANLGNAKIDESRQEVLDSIKGTLVLINQNLNGIVVNAYYDDDIRADAV